MRTTAMHVPHTLTPQMNTTTRHITNPIPMTRQRTLVTITKRHMIRTINLSQSTKLKSTQAKAVTKAKTKLTKAKAKLTKTKAKAKAKAKATTQPTTNTKLSLLLSTNTNVHQANIILRTPQVSLNLRQRRFNNLLHFLNTRTLLLHFRLNTFLTTLLTRNLRLALLRHHVLDNLLHTDHLTIHLTLRLNSLILSNHRAFLTIRQHTRTNNHNINNVHLATYSDNVQLRLISRILNHNNVNRRIRRNKNIQTIRTFTHRLDGHVLNIVMVLANLLSLLLGQNPIILHHLGPHHDHLYRTLHLFNLLLNLLCNLLHNKGLILNRIVRQSSRVNGFKVSTNRLLLRTIIIQCLLLMFVLHGHDNLLKQNSRNRQSHPRNRYNNGHRDNRHAPAFHRLRRYYHPSVGTMFRHVMAGWAKWVHHISSNDRVVRLALHTSQAAHNNGSRLRVTSRQCHKHGHQRRRNPRRRRKNNRPRHHLHSRQRPLRTNHRPVNSRRLSSTTRYTSHRRQSRRKHRRTLRSRQRSGHPIQDARRARSLYLILPKNNTRTGHHHNRRSNSSRRSANRRSNSRNNPIRRQRRQIRSLPLISGHLRTHTPNRRLQRRLMFNQILRLRARQVLRVKNNRNASLMRTIQMLLRRHILRRLLTTRVHSL